jgi:SNF2 family DNA or RNA helicase
MIHLTKQKIRSLAIDELTYNRGLAYFKNGHIKNAYYSKSIRKYKFIVAGSSTYTVQINELDDGKFDFSCTCPGNLMSSGACKHVVCALCMLYKRQEKAEGNLPKTSEEKRIYDVLDYFDNQDNITMTGDVFHIEPVLSIPEMLKNGSGKAGISIKVGSSRLYKVQNLKKFLDSFVRREPIVLGKDFHFIYGESAFDRDSKSFLDYLLGIFDVADLTAGKDGTEIFSKSQMQISKFLFIKLLHQIGNLPCTLELYGNTYFDVHCVTSNPTIEFDLINMEDSCILDYKDKEPVIPISENGEVLYRDGFLYTPDKVFLRNFLPFFNNLGGDRTPLVFEGKYKQRFLETVLPKLHDTMELEIPEDLSDKYIAPDFTAEVYFDKYNNYIKAELFFTYGEYRFNSFETPKSDPYIILRNKTKEKEISDVLEKNGFETYSGFYLLKADAGIYSFITEGIEELKTMAELFYSEDFKHLKSSQNRRFSIGLNVSKESDLLELDLTYGDITKEELKQLFRAYRLKKKFFRLSDGSFIDLESDELNELSEKLDDLNLSMKEIEKKDRLRISKGLALFADRIFDEGRFTVTKNEEFKALVSNVLNSAEKEYTVPENINAELRPYQVTGFKWLMNLAENGLGGILADDMGLGKTLQAIVYIRALLNEDPEAKFLVICPTSVVYNWLDEFETFAPGIRAKIIEGTPQDREALIKKKDDSNVLITSYPLIRRDIGFYDDMQFDTIFLDEAQFIKNAASVNAKSVKSLVAKHRFALTGTPIENSLSELWSIFDFIMPFYLLSYTKFIMKYEKPVAKGDEGAKAVLNRRIRPFVMRRMKRDVLVELPEKIEEKMVADLNPEQKNLYLSYLESVKGDLRAELLNEGINASRFQILAALTRLRQICCHPSTFLENYTGGSGKLDLFMEIVPNLISNGHRILVFSQFTSMLELIKKALDDMGYSYFYLDGSTKNSERSERVKAFNAGERQLFLISLKAGGTGLNLTGADSVIHFDPWWNPAVEEQATDRAHRIGQKNVVEVIKLITKGTIEEKIYKLQNRKKELSEAIISTKEVFINSLTKEEIMELFSLD